MKRLIFSLSVLCVFSLALTGQDTTYQPPTNLRNEPETNPWPPSWKVKLIWTPPAGWAPSAVDRWYNWDKGIWDGNSLGSCVDCAAEAAARWDAAMISMYDTVYLTKIRFLLTEPEINYKLRVYQGTPESFDTLLNHTLQDSLVYNEFDTLKLTPILLDPSKDLWIGYWVNSLAYGFPLPIGPVPTVNGYSNMIRVYMSGGWETLEYTWIIGGFLETPHDSIIYPVFNIYRAIDDQPFEKITESPYLDTIYYDYFDNDLDPSHLYYYITCVYEDGESEPSDTLHISLVNTPEIIKNNNIKIYPNPATDKVSIESVKGRIKSISLIDSHGSTVIEKTVSDKRIDLDISHLNSSIYIIRVITAEGMFTSKLLIVK
jgi:hypothetical protein